jgi:hypothetical protein
LYVYSQKLTLYYLYVNKILGEFNV